MRDSLAAGQGNIKISFQEANHEGMLKRTWWQLVPSHGRSNTQVVLPENGTKVKPAAGDGRSSAKVVLPENKSSRPPETAVPVLNL